MLITHAHALDKDCVLPLVDQYADHQKCKAFRCMAWRWNNTQDGQDQTGYCGLAGRPMNADKGFIERMIPELLSAAGLKPKKKTITVPVKFEV